MFSNKQERGFPELAEFMGRLFKKTIVEPPFVVTSKPVPVKNIWGSHTSKKGLIFSIIVHAIAILFLTTLAVKHRGVQNAAVTLLSSKDIGIYVPELTKKSGGGGGGGDRSPEPALKGRAPKSSMEQLTPPAVIVRNESPNLPVEPTVLVPPDIKLPRANINQLGDLRGLLGPPSNGPGSGSGIGSGSGGGVGSGAGGGVGPGSGGGFGGGAFRVGNGVTAPQLIFRVEPEYSETARKAKYQGIVLLYAVINVKGKVENLRVVRSLGLGLDEKAYEAVKQWQFRPGTKDGRPVAVVVSIEITFRLL